MDMPNDMTFPVVPLRGGVVFPSSVTTVAIGRNRSLRAAQAALENNTPLLILIQYDADEENPSDDSLVPIGVLAMVRDLVRGPQDGVQMVIELRERVSFLGLAGREPYLSGRCAPAETTDGAPATLMAQALAYVDEYARLVGEVNRHLAADLRTHITAGQLADYLAGLLTLPFEAELTLLTTLDGVERLEQVLVHLKREVQVAEIRAKIQQDAREGADRAQREFLLREQMKAIRRELGEESDNILTELRDRLAAAEMPALAYERAIKELKRLERQGEQSPEAAVIRTYLEWLSELPWNKLSEDNLDVDHVRMVLDEDHYGLEDVKQRFVEYVAVRKLAGRQMKGPIINLNGPPGVGKTSIATSVARAMGRKMVRISLGGVHDEAEIRGHRRTYIGALPGRLVRALRDVQTRNPVIVLDEIDKIGSDWRGDPSSALLEVLDPEQNHSFTDHYLELPFDLSQVIFITTSNTVRTIPPALRDRMEILDMEGYVEDEKVEIARAYLIKKQLTAHGLAEVGVNFEEETLRRLIRYYTYEAGVRQLERLVGSLVRKVAVQVARDEPGPFTITPEMIATHLGPEKVSYGKAEEQDEVGVVTGLAVVGDSGDTLSIEVRLSEGNGQLRLTGSLGSVMQESAQAALTYARVNARRLGLEPLVFDHTNIHIHVPAGAQPKDGPSAGLALTTAIISALTQRPVRKDVAMTGEVTLRGKALAIGGLKSKAIAAHRAGVKTVLFPHDNLRDVPDLPERVRADLILIPVRHVEEVLEHALLAAVGPPWYVRVDGRPEENLTPTPAVP